MGYRMDSPWQLDIVRIRKYSEINIWKSSGWLHPKCAYKATTGENSQMCYFSHQFYQMNATKSKSFSCVLESQSISILWVGAECLLCTRAQTQRKLRQRRPLPCSPPPTLAPALDFTAQGGLTNMKTNNGKTVWEVEWWDDLKSRFGEGLLAGVTS